MTRVQFRRSRKWVEACLNLASPPPALTDGLHRRATALGLVGLKPLDSAHLAAAEAAKADFFVNAADRRYKRYPRSDSRIDTAELILTLLWNKIMSIVVESDRKSLREAVAILLERMPASKVARLLSAWQVGFGDYTMTDASSLPRTRWTVSLKRLVRWKSGNANGKFRVNKNAKNFNLPS